MSISRIFRLLRFRRGTEILHYLCAIQIVLWRLYAERFVQACYVEYIKNRGIGIDNLQVMISFSDT